MQEGPQLESMKMGLREFCQELGQEDVVRALESAIGQIPVLGGKDDA